MINQGWLAYMATILNTYTRNGAEFTAVDIISNPRYPGWHLADDVTIYFGSSLGILLE